MPEHRVSLRDLSLRRHDDPEHSTDPRVQHVLTALRTLEIAPEPRPHFKAELRAQLVAVAPRVIAEGEPTAATGTTTSAATATAAPARARTSGSARPVARRAPRIGSGSHATAGGSLAARLPHISFGRPLAVAASVAVALGLGLGGTVWYSQGSVPGDALYGLKRTSETVQLDLAGSNQAKAHDYLEFAQRRADEVQTLLSRAQAVALGGKASAGGVNPQTARLVTSTLSAADADLSSGSSLLGTQAVHSGSASPLAFLTDWAPGQAGRLATIESALPAGPVRARAAAARHLVVDAMNRATSLQTQLSGRDASEVRSCSTGSDALGPLPCATLPSTVTGGATAVPGTSQEPSASARASSPAAHHSSSAANGSNTSGNGSNTGSTNGPGSISSVPSQLPSSVPTKLPTTFPTLLPTKLPSLLPTKLPSLPVHLPSSLPTSLPSNAVSVSTCGVSVLGIGVGC